MDNTINKIFRQQGELKNIYRVFYNEEEENADELNQVPGVDRGQQTQQGQQAGLLAPTVPQGVQAPAGQAPAGQPGVPGQPVDGVVAPAANVAPGDATKAAAVVADAMLGKGGKSMKPDEVTKVLAEKGIQSRAVEIDGKKGVEVLDNTGNVVTRLRDTDGNGSIGAEDKEFLAELQKIGYANVDQLAAAKGEKGQKALAKVKGGEAATAMDRTGAAITAPTADAAKAGTAAKGIDPLDPTKKTEENVENKNAIGGPENKADGKYKYQVNDTNLKNCPKGKPACTGCGDCPKGEIFKQLKANGTLEQVLQGGGDTNAAGVQKVEAPKLAKAKADGVGGPNEALKAIQAELTAAGFVDKTAEELLAEGTLKEIATHLGLYVPESIF
jgi:hypothetical protein